MTQNGLEPIFDDYQSYTLPFKLQGYNIYLNIIDLDRTRTYNQLFNRQLLYLLSY